MKKGKTFPIVADSPKLFGGVAKMAIVLVHVLQRKKRFLCTTTSGRAFLSTKSLKKIELKGEGNAYNQPTCKKGKRNF